MDEILNEILNQYKKDELFCCEILKKPRPVWTGYILRHGSLLIDTNKGKYRRTKRKTKYKRTKKISRKSERPFEKDKPDA